MKLSKDAALAFFAKPDPKAAGVLIYGPDAMRVALKRQELIAALIGPEGEDEMRLTRMTGSELRKDKSQLIDAMKAIGFFPGVRAVLVEDANDQIVDVVADSLDQHAEGDAQIVVTAGQLKPTSKLRKTFESHPSARCAAIYNDPPGRAEIEQMLAKTGLEVPSGETMAALMDLSRALEPGDFQQTLEKLSLYMLGSQSQFSLADIAACAPSSFEAEVDDVLLVVGDGEAARIGPVMQRLVAQGINPTTLSIGAMRYFRTLHRIANAPGGRAQVWGPHRDRIMSQARRWGPARLETALTILTDTELKLRAAGVTAPAMALVERALIRLAMLGNG